MKTHLTTERLSLRPLSIADTQFIQELVNSPGWIQFIGDRNIHNEADSLAYIQRILGNEGVFYWVATTQMEQTELGVITYITRDYLPHPDIGFAFLPQFTGKGYAHEAAKAALTEVMNSTNHAQILATTLKENIDSIRLLEKLGLKFDKAIEVENEELLLYAITVK